MQINLDWESSALSAPQSWRDTVQSAANYLAATLNDNISVTIKVGYGDYNNGQTTGLTTGALGGYFYSVNVSYQALRTALLNDASSSVDTSFVNSLPNTTSINGVSSFWVPEAAAKALGLWTFGNSYEDGAIGLGTQIASGNLFGVAFHEIAHAIGRISGSTGSLVGPLDLAQYSSPGVINVNGTNNPGYFSIDGGVTQLAKFSTDPGDFDNSGVQGMYDPFNAIYYPQTIQTLTTVDKDMLDILGFDLTSQSAGYDQSAILADFNGDHRIDVLQVSNSNAFVHLSTGASFAARAYWGSGFTTSDKAVDVNGDGKADMVQYYGGNEWVALSNGSTFGAWSVWSSGATSSDKLVDVNGDGKADLVQYYGGNEWVALSNGTKFGNWTQWASGASSTDKLVDLNGDHKADLLQFYNGNVYVALSNGSGFGTWSHWSSGGTVSDQNVDVNGDGKADLVQIYNGKTYVALSTGTSFGNWNAWASGATSSDHVVDVNGDGKADLVQFYNGAEWVALSNGTVFGSWSQWGTGASSTDQLIDLNGDGKVDILQFYNGSAYAALSNGSSFGPWQTWGTPGATDNTSVANGVDHGTLTSTPVTDGTDTFNFATAPNDGPVNSATPWFISSLQTAAPELSHVVATEDVSTAALGGAMVAQDKMDVLHLLHTADFILA